MLRFALLVLFFGLARNEDAPPEYSQCGQAARAETYLETAVAMIDKAMENLPAEGFGDCSCPPKPMDCDEVMKCGKNRSGVYRIWPRNRIMFGSVDVFCDLETDGGGWTVIQRRGDNKRPADFFYKSWHKYKTGFGDLNRDFWLGNENIYALTNQKKYYLRIDLSDSSNITRYAFYDQFWIDNESQQYKLHVHDYSGNAGDALSNNGGYMFSTMDKDNDNSTDHCAEKYKGAWWYTSCGSSNLNGLYHVTKQGLVDTVSWGSLGGKTDLKETIVKIRPLDFRTSLLDMNVEPK